MIYTTILFSQVKHLEYKVARSKSQSTISMYLKLFSMMKPKFKSMRRSRNAGDLFDPMQFYLEALKKEQEILEQKGTPPPYVDPNESFMPDVLGGIIDNVPHVGVNGKIPQSVLPGGYDKISATDIQWQALHMSAAGACRSLSKATGHAGIHSVVLLRNAAERKNCRHLCSLSWASKCSGEVSLWGIPGRGKKNGQEVGTFYNYGCDYGYNGGSEAWAKDRDISKNLYGGHQYFYSYCCCTFYWAVAKQDNC